MKIKVILNPYANRWQAGRKVEMVRQAFTAVGLSPTIHQTTAPGEATAVARQAATQYDGVVAAGGDGTINEVINGLLQAAGDGATVPFGIMPIGTANDLSDTTHIPRDLTAAAQLLAHGRVRAIDAVRVNDHFFINNCAIGMEPLVTQENIKIRRLSGNLRYLLALIRAMRRLQAWQMEICFDEERFVGPALLLSVCNGPRTGGIFQMAPGALFDDGYVDYVFAPELPKRTVLGLLPRLLNGSHLQHPQVHHGRARRIRIRCQPGTPVHADGELIAEAATQIDYELLPAKVSLLAP